MSATGPAQHEEAARGLTVLVPVLNDREDLAQTLAALAAQERQADEVLFVDGGSTDGTLELLLDWCSEHPGARVIRAPEANISQARNAGVLDAANEWIACTDAGCLPARGWLGAFDGARPGHDFLAGIWEVDGSSAFERCVAIALHPNADEGAESSAIAQLWHALFGRRFSSRQATGRSMAFTRAAWQGAGGFPVELYAGEDVAFSWAVHEAGCRAALVPEATVRWRTRGGWRATARMYASYARGDIRRPPRRAHLVRAAGVLGAVALTARFGFRGLAVCAVGFGFYLWLPYARARRSGLRWPQYVLVIPALVVLKDLANLAGAAAGLSDMARGRDQPRLG